MTDDLTTDELRALLSRRGPLLNARQVAARVGVQEAAISRRLSRGTMPTPIARDEGKRPLWLPEQIDEMQSRWRRA